MAPTHASDESSIVAHVGIPTLVSYVVATSIYAILLAALNKLGPPISIISINLSSSNF